MPLTIVDGPTIAAGESLSDAADCSGGQIVRITVPQEYTAGSERMTFQVSSDGNFFNDMYDVDGKLIAVVSKPNTSIVIDQAWTRAVGFIKIRSGTPEQPVEQREVCRLGIAVLSEAADAPLVSAAGKKR
jgi:hypothetical protein